VFFWGVTLWENKYTERGKYLAEETQVPQVCRDPRVLTVTLWRVRHIALMLEIKDTQRNLVEKPTGKWQRGRPDGDMRPGESLWCVTWMEVVQHRVWCRTSAVAVFSFKVLLSSVSTKEYKAILKSAE
jgi:hypothetical protein